MMLTTKNLARAVLAVGCCMAAFASQAANVFLKNGANGHWSDPNIWQNDTLPAKGECARLYSPSEIGGKVIVETEADWIAFTNAGEAVMYYGGQLTLDVGETDRVCPVSMGGGAVGKDNKLFKKGSGKLTMATQNFKGITEIQAGTMAMGPTSEANAGVYDVWKGATLVLASDRTTCMLGLRGAGTVTGTGGKQLAFVTTAFAGSDPEVKPPHHFSGLLTGSIDLTAGVQNGSTRGADQYFDNTNSLSLVSTLRMYKGTFSVKKVGTTKVSDPSSIGNSSLSYFSGFYNVAGDVFGLRYTGTEPETTDKHLSLSYSTNPGRFFLFDAGAYGGVTFTYRMSCFSELDANAATCFILDGSNTTACVIDTEILERLNGNVSTATKSGHVFLKRGTGTWRLGSSHTHGNKGPILVERGRLEYTSLAEAGEYCALGLMTHWSTNFYAVADCPPVSFAYLLGNGDNTVSSETATMAYTNATAVGICSTRPLALKGAGRFANDSGHLLSYAGATAAEADKDATLVLAGTGMGTFAQATNGIGRLAVVKEGTNVWNLTDGIDVAAVTAKQGTLLIGRGYQFYRWTVTANNKGDDIAAGTWMGALNGFAVMDAAGNMVNGTLGKSGVSTAKIGHPEQLEPGEITYSESKFTGTGNVNRPIDRAFDWNPDKQNFRGTDASIEYTIKKSDPTTHPVIYFRPDLGVQVAKYDVMASGNISRDVVCWNLAGSMDGKNWDPLHTRETNSLTGYTALSANQWHSTGTSTRGGWDIASGKAGGQFVIGSVSAATNATVAFVGNAAGTSVSNIVLSANGGGAISGATIAETGTLDLTDWNREKLGTEIPLDLTGCTDYENVAGWTLKAGGKPLNRQFRVTPTGITVEKRGLVILVK